MFPVPHSLAVIDGTLCQLDREGKRSVDYAPLATAVLEFRQSPWRVLVREHPHGLLPGLANLYCLDGDLKLRWIADWPSAIGACSELGDEDDQVVTAESADGTQVRLDARTGRLLGLDLPLAAVG